MEGAVGEAVYEGVDAHGQDGGVGGEEEGGEGVAKAGEEEEKVGPGTLEPVGQHSGEDAAGQTSHRLPNHLFTRLNAFVCLFLSR